MLASSCDFMKILHLVLFSLRHNFWGEASLQQTHLTHSESQSYTFLKICMVQTLKSSVILVCNLVNSKAVLIVIY